MSTLKTGTVQNNTGTGAPLFKNNAGTEIGQLAKVWCNFQGTGTTAIRDDFNVNTVTDNGTGDYTVTFSNAMGNTNYSFVSGGYNTYNGDGSWNAIGSQNSSNLWPTNVATTSIRINSFDNQGNTQDQSAVMFAVFGD
jgi:hypothetical protein